MLAAAAQGTQRIELGTVVSPLGWENALRFAEEQAMIDVPPADRFRGQRQPSDALRPGRGPSVTQRPQT